MASAITMGLSWGLGGLIQAPVTAYYRTTGIPQQALLAFVPCLALAALGAWFLPVVSSMTREAEELNRSPQQRETRPDPVDA